MKSQLVRVQTCIGPIAVWASFVDSPLPPVVLLHGVYFDHHLWDDVAANIENRTVVALDMPSHGESRQDVLPTWTLDDCVQMLVQVINTLRLPPVVAIGHSWGSMTILRAAHLAPECFAALGLCNMPHQASDATTRLAIRLQHMALFLRTTYMRQAARFLMGKTSLRRQPALVERLKTPMSLLSSKTIRHTDYAVRITATDATNLLATMPVSALALVGAEDYVGITPHITTTVVPGGHVSPIEQPEAVSKWLTEVLQLAPTPVPST